jgi:hypothetical protein
VNELALSSAVCGFVIGGALFGIYLRPVLPADHVGEETRSIVVVAIGLIATLAALVLGLLVASAKSAFDLRAEELKQSSARIILLDRTLRHYGPEALDIRTTLRQLTEHRLDRTWGQHAWRGPGIAALLPASGANIERVEAQLLALKPAGEEQRWLHTRALTITGDLEQARWMLYEQSRSSIPMPFLVVLVSWLTVIFAILGLLAPRNGTVYAVILICAVSVSTAVYLILEMDQPFEGILQISSAPLANALAEIARP